jgi:hypothetical protein
MRRNNVFIKDYYDILGVPISASNEDIKRAYRLLAKQFHPDVSKEQDAEDKFKDVLQAYRTLKDPVERGYYNSLREQAKSKRHFEQNRDDYRHWQSPPPRKSLARKAAYWLIVLFWMFIGITQRIGRIAAFAVLTSALALFQRVFPFVAVVLIVAGLIFEGNPFRLATWRPHPELTFLCFGFPILALALAILVQFFTEWLSQEGPLFPSVQNKINAWRYRSLCS